MRRAAAVTIIAALAAAAVTTTMSGAASAAPVFTLVDGTAVEGRSMYGASDDGRYVLTDTAEFSGGTPLRLIDLNSGSSVTLPSFVGRQLYLSGDGRRLVFETDAQLDPSDDDLLTDVYSMSIVDHSDVRWLSPGYDQYAITPAATNEDGSVAAMYASSRALFEAHYVIGGSGGVRDLANAGTDFTIHGMSDDGDLVLYSVFVDCGGAAGCVPYPLMQFDRRTGVAAPRAFDATGAPVQASPATITGDGSCIAYVEFVNKGVWRQCGEGLPQSVLNIPASSGMSYRCKRIAISDDALTVTWLGFETLRMPNGSTFAVPGVMQRSGAGPVEQLTTDGAGYAAGAVNCVQPTDRGLLIATSTDAFTPGGGIGIERVHLLGEPSTTPTSTPPTTIPPTTTAPSVGSAGPLPTGAGVFTGRTPLRILDTRTGLGTTAGLPARGTSIRIPVRGLHGVPADATAVAVQLTATEGAGVGYVSLIPGGTQPGFTSSLNLDVEGETIANSAIVPIGADGSITLYTNAPTHVIVDLAGWWTPSSGATSAGRFQPVGPVRMLDTRPDSIVGATGTKPAAGSITQVQVTGRLGVPASGVSAVVLNVTIAEPESLGFVQAAPAASLQPGASSTLNVGRAGQVIAASTIVPVDSQGRIALYAQPSTHLIVDVAGWFTDASVAAGTDGMFVPDPSGQSPRRLDTRPGSGLWNGPKPVAGQRFGLPAAGQAIVGNVTVVDTDGAGFVQMGPSDTMVNGTTSNINPTRAGETVANAFIVPVGSSRVDLFTSVGTHVIVDVSGYMTA